MSERKDLVFCCVGILLVFFVVFGALAIIPVMMIVYGAQNPTVSCNAPCVMYECDLPQNKPYILPTPRIGINVSQALIIGGVLGIMLISAFMFFQCYHSKDKFFTPLLLVPTIPFLAAVAWMIVSFIVYSQTIELCTTHNRLWRVETTTLKWLLGSCIGGMLVLVGPYVIPYVLAGITAPCTNSKGVEQPCDCRIAVCPCLFCVDCGDSTNNQPRETVV